MEVSTVAAFNHINTYVHPQATIVDGSGEEELWFLKALGDRAISLGRTVIELPDNAEKNLMWITLLDSSSLRGRWLGHRTWELYAKFYQLGTRCLLISLSMPSLRPLAR
jgi:hypothetical protein